MAGPQIGAALDEAVQTLHAAGIRASTDPAKLNPPAAYVVPVSAEPVNLAGEYEVLVDLVLVVPDNGVAQSYTALDTLADDCTAVLPLADGDVFEAVSLVLPGSSTALPAYRYQTPIYTQTP